MNLDAFDAAFDDVYPRARDTTADVIEKWLTVSAEAAEHNQSSCSAVSAVDRDMSNQRPEGRSVGEAGV